MPAVASRLSHVLRLDTPLGPFFAPRSVAVIGATDKPDSVGLSVMTNLTKTPFGRPVFPVNPPRAAVLGIAAYPAIGAAPGPVSGVGPVRGHEVDDD